MIVAPVIATLALVVAALLRAGAASLLRTARADAVVDATESVKGAGTAARLLDNRDPLQPAITAVHAGLLVTAAVPATWVVTRRFVGPALVLAMVLLALGLVLVGDLLPRGVGRSQPRRLAYRLAPLLSGAVRLGAWANDLLPDQEVEEEEEPPPAEEEEERRLISSVLEFSDTIVREVMVPRTDMVTVRLDASLTDLLGLITEHGYSRYPVVDPRSEDIVGLVIARDLLPLLAGGERPATIAALMRPVDFVPETKRVSDLLREMQVSKTHLAVVSDEFGDVAGLVSIEDLLEELVGEIVDEYDEEVPLVRASGASSWLVDGRAGVDVLAEVVRTALPDDDWDTVGGLVLGLAGRLPEEDEEVAFGDLTFRVVRLQGRRVAEVEVRKMERVASDERR